MLHENSFKTFCKILQKDIRTAKAKFYHAQFEKYKSDIRKTWSKINELITKKSKSSDFPKYFMDKDEILTDDKDIATCFNNFFCKYRTSTVKINRVP